MKISLVKQMLEKDYGIDINLYSKTELKELIELFKQLIAHK